MYHQSLDNVISVFTELTDPWGVQDTYPRMQLTCSDLSPFYLATARENHDYWRRMRQPSLAAQDQTKFLQTAAEKIAAADNSYDVVSAALRKHFSGDMYFASWILAT